jgi:hypothetical protein
MAVGALAGLALLMQQADGCDVPPSLRMESWRDLSHQQAVALLCWIWKSDAAPDVGELATYVVAAKPDLNEVLNA